MTTLVTPATDGIYAPSQRLRAMTLAERIGTLVLTDEGWRVK